MVRRDAREYLQNARVVGDIIPSVKDEMRIPKSMYGLRFLFVLDDVDDIDPVAMMVSASVWVEYMMPCFLPRDCVVKTVCGWIVVHAEDKLTHPAKTRIAGTLEVDFMLDFLVLLLLLLMLFTMRVTLW